MLLFALFFFNDTATTEIYTLPYTTLFRSARPVKGPRQMDLCLAARQIHPDRKSTRLNSSHANISYAVFCLQKKSKNNTGAARQELPAPHCATKKKKKTQ